MSQYLDKVFLYLLISGNSGHYVLLFLSSIEELLGYRSMETTMVYTHVVAEMNKSKDSKPFEYALDKNHNVVMHTF